MAQNPLGTVVAEFQELVAVVPELVRPLIVGLASAIPFIEGEIGAVIGVAGGLHPVLAAGAAATGNLLCVAFIIFFGGRLRQAITKRRGGTRSGTPKPPSKGRQRFNRWFARFGVPGASLLGPLAIPTQFTAAALVAAGVPPRRILLWQAVAIVLWTSIATASITAAITLAT